MRKKLSDAKKAKKDATIPGFRVSSEVAEKLVEAIDKLALEDYPEVRREAVRDLVRISTNGEHLIRPIRLLTWEMLNSKDPPPLVDPRNTGKSISDHAALNPPMDKRGS